MRPSLEQRIKALEQILVSTVPPTIILLLGPESSKAIDSWRINTHEAAETAIRRYGGHIVTLRIGPQPGDNRQDQESFPDVPFDGAGWGKTNKS